MIFWYVSWNAVFPSVRIILCLSRQGNFVLQSVRVASKYVSTFPEAWYLMNSQIYEGMKFYPLLSTLHGCQKCPILANEAKFTHIWAARGKSFWSWRFTVVNISNQNFLKIMCQIDRITVWRNVSPSPPNLIIQDIQPPTLSRIVDFFFTHYQKPVYG